MVPISGLVGVEKEPYADTILCPQSKEAILRACGAGIESANELMSGLTKRQPSKSMDPQRRDPCWKAAKAYQRYSRTMLTPEVAIGRCHALQDSDATFAARIYKMCAISS